MKTIRVSIQSFIIILLSLITTGVVGQKCSLVTKDDEVRCENLSNLTLLELNMRKNWNNVQVLNRATATLTIGKPADSSKFTLISALDLSRSGRVVLQSPYFVQFPGLISLNLTNTKLTQLSGNWFAASNRLRTLDLSRNRIVSLNRNQFKNLTRLQVLHLSHNDIAAINATTFSDAVRLRELHLTNNRLTRVQLGIMPNLQMLSMSNNLIGALANDVFVGLPALEEIHLQNNRITTIQPRAFGNLTYLRVLNLGSNQLHRLRARSFSDLDQIELEHLDLSNNGITEIDDGALSDLRQLRKLNLSRNSLHNSLSQSQFQGLRHLKSLDLTDNQINEIPPNTFQALAKLEFLDLSQNSIEVFRGNVFGTAGQQLRHLILTRNALLDIEEGSFDNLDSLLFLYLDYNSLHHLHENLFANNFELKQLALNDNALEEILWAHLADLTKIEVLLLHRNRLTYFPAPRGILSKLTRLSIGFNPWQCKCLNDLLIWAQKNDIAYMSTSFNGERPVCVAVPSDKKGCVRDQDWVNQNNIVPLFEMAISEYENKLAEGTTASNILMGNV